MKKRIKTSTKILIWITSLSCILALILGTVYIASQVEYNSLGDTNLPRIEVVTKNNAEITSKEDYVECTVRLTGAEQAFCFDNASAGIRGRGNTTWFTPAYGKKPYRIKFDEKTSLFGEKKNKSWVLLALINDFTYTKERLAFSLAESLNGDAFVPSHHYVELYLNGSYNGLYLLTDQVDENSGRTDVKEDFDETDTQVPFLVELDDYAPNEGVENVDWFSVFGKPYAIKYPEADERYTQTQFDYIKNYIQTVDDLCRTPNVTIAQLEQYIDVESFLNYFFVQEIMGQPEINWKSVYMSKSKNGKLVMGPLWDFDWSLTGPYLGYYINASVFPNAYKNKVEGFRSTDNWFASLYNGSQEFRDKAAEVWAKNMPTFVSTIDEVERTTTNIATAARKDRLRWHWHRIGRAYEDCLEESFSFCRGRIDWLDDIFNK